MSAVQRAAISAVVGGLIGASISVTFDLPWGLIPGTALGAVIGSLLANRTMRRAEERRARILEALGGRVAMSGLELSRAAEVSAGRVYSDLAYLEGKGWVKSGWEIPPPVGRPARRMYFR